MKIEEALDQLFAMKRFSVKLGLETITKFLAYLGNPQNNLKIFHIAGSNGKGSTASFLKSILMEAGYNVGLYTSPHYVDFNERISINGIQISDDEILKFLEEHQDFIKENETTFFEITTAMMFNYFANAEVDFAVIEVGLGGRLDATNVITPIAALITTISLEHKQILGDTLEAIANEKGDIIKAGSRAFFGIMPDEALDVLKTISVKRGCDYKILNEEIKFDTEKFHFNGLNIYKTPLAGSHQLYNLALSVLAVQSVVEGIGRNSILNGIKNVVKNTKIQGRYEIFHKNPTVIFDSAHNPQSLGSFLQTFKNEENIFNNKELIIGVLNDKDYKNIFDQLIPYFDSIKITSIKNERSQSVDLIAEHLVETGASFSVHDNPEEYFVGWLNDNNHKNDCLVVLGSIYLVGQIKKYLMGLKST
ncbi:MAG: bifunctional folylpolyglutamate synthase/dihydrofolate synthase [Melioribacteraceae bacterium]|nr:bifunctional folylpolyglutamate synthase/dihydrofolate synthase [Melioribacteraceae bacterium]MCF8264260.1 bifunctional folylpolyglutamate synthase/dihydrofolate synthase [Melioribacteraceae bacterium]MCF8431760.1 bifunctional folylpolyglutamate synthase/dihydrofolate synthase [Melioribacteraceae bacterium]